MTVERTVGPSIISRKQGIPPFENTLKFKGTFSYLGTQFLSREGIGIVPELIALKQATTRRL